MLSIMEQNSTTTLLATGRMENKNTFDHSSNGRTHLESKHGTIQHQEETPPQL
jgi:hypothetical protein